MFDLKNADIDIFNSRFVYFLQVMYQLLHYIVICAPPPFLRPIFCLTEASFIN